MGKIYSNRNSGNTSAGGVAPKMSQQIISEHIEKLKENLAPMKQQEESLDNIDAVVGRPVEKKISRDLLIAAPKEWNFFPKASDEKIQEISESIRQYGLFHNITVWAREDGKYMILGGHTRVACFDYLASTHPEEDESHWKQIPALVYSKDQITENDAKRIIIVSNTDQRDISKITKAKAYLSLFELEKEKSFYGSYVDTMASAASQVKTSRMGFFRYLQLLKLIPELQDLVSTETIPVSTAYHLSFLPNDLQKYIFQMELYKELSNKGAEQIKKCKSIPEIDDKIDELNSVAKYFKYTFQTRKKKAEGEEVLPVWVNKSQRNEVADLYIKAVQQADFPDEIKGRLIEAMSKAKI